MRRVVQSGTDCASPDWAHAVHVEVGGLAPDRWYWYRFRAGGAVSPVGRTRTAPRRWRRRRRGCASRSPRASTTSTATSPPTATWSPTSSTSSSTSATTSTSRAGAAIRAQPRRGRAVHARRLPRPPRALQDRPRSAGGARGVLRGSSRGTTTRSTTTTRTTAREELDAPELFLRGAPPPTRPTTSTCRCRGARVALGPHVRLYARSDFGAPRALPRARRPAVPRSAGLPAARPRRLATSVGRDCSERLDPARTLLGREQERWLRAGLARSTRALERDRAADAAWRRSISARRGRASLDRRLGRLSRARASACSTRSPADPRATRW